MSRFVPVALVTVLAGLMAGCDLPRDSSDRPFVLKVTPESIGDSIPGERIVLLATVEDQDESAEDAKLVEQPVRILATANEADVTVENAWIVPGDVAEVSVVPHARPDQPEDSTWTISVCVMATRGELEHATAVRITITSQEKDLVGPLAKPIRDLFIPWLADNHPELGITQDTQWTGTIVSPHILVVTHYRYFSDEWEMHVYWHVMIEPYNWGRIELRRRFRETAPSLGFEIPSITADPLEFKSFEPDGTLWR